MRGDVEEFDKWCEYMEEHEDDPNAMTWKEWKERIIVKNLSVFGQGGFFCFPTFDKVTGHFLKNC